MKKLILATVALSILAGGASAGGQYINEIEGGHFSSYWTDVFQDEHDVGWDGRTSTITVRGRYGNHIDDDEGKYRFLHGIKTLTNSTIIDETAEFNGNESTSYKRDFVEYKVEGDNEDQVFYVVELNDPGLLATRIPNGCPTSANPEHPEPTLDSCKQDDFHNDGYEGKDGMGTWNQNLYKEASFWDTDRKDENGSGANSITVESNYNSKAYISHVLGFNHKNFAVTTELDVYKESQNEDAKQIVASAVALAFDKFDNLSGSEAKQLINDSLKIKIDHESLFGIFSSTKKSESFGTKTFRALLGPAGQLR